MESLLWASECFNRSASAANDGWLSPHDICYGNRPPLPLLPFFQPCYHGVPRQRKSDPRARLCYFLNFGYNHGHDCHKLLDAETGKVVFSCDITWHHPEAPLIPPATAVGNPPTAPPEDIYVPISTPVPSVAAPAPRSSTTCYCAGSITDACPRSYADTRTIYVTTACIYVELPSSDPPAC